MAENIEQIFELSNNKQLSDLLRELSVLRERGSFCDVVVEVQSRRFLAHKAVLSSTCEYFRSLFLDVPCSSMGPFVVDFVTMKTFEHVMNFIYKGQIRATREEMRELCYAATDLGMECLEEACNSFHLEEELVTDPINEERRYNMQGALNYLNSMDLHGRNGQKDRADLPAMPPLNKCSPTKCAGSQPNNMQNSNPSEDGCDKGADNATTGDEVKIEPLECEVVGGEGEDLGEAYGALDNLTILHDGKVERAEEDSYGAKPVAYPRLDEPYAEFADDLPLGIPCQACNEFVGDSDDCMREHARTAHLDAAAMTCRVCGKRFRVLSNAEQHVALHMGVTALHCYGCRKQFFSEERLSLHRAQGCGKQLKSPASGARFAGVGPAAPEARAAPSLLASSPRSSTPGGGGGGGNNNNNVVWCRTCGEMVFKTMSALRLHARTHVDTSSMLCNVCGQQSTFISNLIKHALLHVGVFLYGCEKCGKHFLMRCRLIVHQKACRGGSAGAFVHTLIK